jgi:hypothetical protein
MINLYLINFLIKYFQIISAKKIAVVMEYASLVNVFALMDSVGKHVKNKIAQICAVETEYV